MNSRMLIAPFSALVLALAPPVAAAQGAPADAPATASQGFEHVLPADTAFFLGVSDLDALAKDFEASTAGRFWADPACEPTRRHIADFRKVWSGKLQELVGVDPLPLLDMVHGAVALAFVGMPAAEDLAEKGLGDGGVVLLADLREDREAAELIIDKLLDAASEDGARLETETAGDEDVTVLKVPGPSGEGIDRAVCLTFHGSTLVVVAMGNRAGRDVLQEVLDGLDGAAGDVLAQAPAFRDSLAAEPGGIRLWADIGRIARTGVAMRQIEKDAAREAQDEDEDEDSPFAYDDDEEEAEEVSGLEMMERVGVNDLGAFAMRSVFGPEGSRSRFHLDWSGEGWGPRLLRLLLGPGVEPALAAVPADCVSMTAAHIDFGGLFDEVFRILIETGELEPPQVVELLSEMETDLGFDLREDLLTLLDGQFTIIAAKTEPEEAFMGSEEDPMNFALVLGLTDGPRFNTLIDDLIRSRGLHAARKRLEFQGHEIFSVPVTPFDVQYAVLPDALVVSLAGSMVQDVLRRRGGADLPSLADDRKYQEAVAGLPRAPGMISYSDAAEQMTSISTSLHTLLELLRTGPEGSEAPGDVMAFLRGMPLPDDAVIRKYYTGGAVSAFTFDEDGLTMEGESR